MKLLLCPSCKDVRKLLFERTVCQCGASWGQYIDNLNASIGGRAIPLGFANSTLLEALRTRPDTGSGSQFTAFVIPRVAPKVRIDGPSRQFTEDLLAALATAGIGVTVISRRDHPGASDLLWIGPENYLAVCFDDQDRIGVVGVTLNEQMPSGGDVEHGQWLSPPHSAQKIANDVADSLE
ncbi:hypothetical protein ABIC83_002963 [Roseateles asaccharophilus]|uniref:hypothetical protein n=1 Tax=Roseateles asaccharophilus TaxID=582607 RepID=UPI0038330C5C